MGKVSILQLTSKLTNAMSENKQNTKTEYSSVNSVGFSELLANKSANELRAYSKKSIESEERTNKMIQDRKNAKFVKAVTESFSIISS